MKASIVAADQILHMLLINLKATVLPTNQVAQVSTVKPYPSPGVGHNVVVIDFGLNIVFYGNCPTEIVI